MFVQSCTRAVLGHCPPPAKRRHLPTRHGHARFLMASLPSSLPVLLQGDSGGPVQCREGRSERYWVLGVLSWGPPSCGAAQRPSVFISLQYFRDWIRQHTKEEFSTPIRLPLFARISTTTRTTSPPTTKPSRPASWLRPPVWARPVPTSSWILSPPQWPPWSPAWLKSTRWPPRTRPNGWNGRARRPRPRHHPPHTLEP